MKFILEIVERMDWTKFIPEKHYFGVYTLSWLLFTVWMFCWGFNYYTINKLEAALTTLIIGVWIIPITLKRVQNQIPSTTYTASHKEETK